MQRVVAGHSSGEEIAGIKPHDWKTPADVEWLRFSLGRDGKPVEIGGYAVGFVFAGMIKFNDGSRQRVAIKRFNRMLSDDMAARYQQTIDDLREAVVDPDTGRSFLPKMAMVRLDGTGEWVQVSQLFGRRDPQTCSIKSKIVNKNVFNNELIDGYCFDIKTLEGRVEAARLFTLTANAGYLPKNDLIEPFIMAEKGVIPIDIDLVVKAGRQRPPLCAKNLYQVIQRLCEGGFDAAAIYAGALETASPAIREELDKLIPEGFGQIPRTL